MFRPVFACARSAVRVATVSRVAISKSTTQPSFARSSQFLPALSLSSVRSYASGGGMSKQEVEGRIMDLLKGFDKVKDASNVAPTAHFSNDLGLDSLDTVEVVMAIEEEFSIEIPDKEADAIHSIGQAVEYIMHQPDAH